MMRDISIGSVGSMKKWFVIVFAFKVVAKIGVLDVGMLDAYVLPISEKYLQKCERMIIMKWNSL